MAHYSKIFHKVPVDIPNKSGFDMSHTNLFTAECGTLTPCLVEPLLPNDTVSLGMFTQIQLPPMATDFYGSIKGKFEVFFVPYRLLYGGWQDVITRSTDNRVGSAGVNSLKLKYIPGVRVPVSGFAPGTLLDYLGYKAEDDGVNDYGYVPNILPLMAYHKIYDDWYRESRIQTPLFEKAINNVTSNIATQVSVRNLPYVTATNVNSPDSQFSINPAVTSSFTFADGVSITSLRQRNWQKDYFTNATPLPQSGEGATLQFTTADNQGSFTIAALRAANSLQRYMERNNIAGFRYADQIKATYGIYPSDAVLDRSIYLGSHTVAVYTKSVFQTSHNPDATQSDKNPFSTVGTKFGSSQGVSDGELVDKFTATEHGFLFVMFSLVPDLQYSTGTRRYFWETSQADIPNPLLQGVGDQSIYQKELTGGAILYDDQPLTYGYTQRYAHYKYHDDEVHGLLRDGQNLSAFALQRSFAPDSNPEISTSILEIPKQYLDQVFAVDVSQSGFSCWVQCGFKFHKSSTLSAYDIPTLGDLRNVHTEVIDNGGRRL